MAFVHVGPVVQTMHMRPYLFKVQRCRLSPRNVCVRCQVDGSEIRDADDGIKCYMSAEGYLVCDFLEPGNYRIESVETQTDTPKQCSLDNPRDCLTYCYVLEDGTMVCEGLPSGEYAIKQAGETEIDDMLEHLEGLKAKQSAEDSSKPGPMDKVIGQIASKLREA
eukprot:jgi/Botrbrau1/5820/Bobra.0366s0006.1